MLCHFCAFVKPTLGYARCCYAGVCILKQECLRPKLRTSCTGKVTSYARFIFIIKLTRNSKYFSELSCSSIKSFDRNSQTSLCKRNNLLKKALSTSIGTLI